MFMVGVIPALLVQYIWTSVPESPDWVARTKALIIGVVAVLIAVLVSLGREPKGTWMGGDPA